MYHFSNPQHTEKLWQIIWEHWTHRDRPFGQRFLGSVQIKQKATDQILDVVGYNFRQLSKITYDNLNERFNDPKKKWLKILTFALSEYAYYYSSHDVGFWEGFCQHLNISYNQGIEKTFRDLAREGFQLLHLVKAKGGYSYVSTLWLQSGIPHRNIHHFAELVGKFSDEYGWWEIAHASAEDISEELLNFCQEIHPEWGTLINFLKSSCSPNLEEVEPISGQLVQGIAVVAGELERQNISPEKLKYENEREQLLKNYYLPQNFFLRDWISLIEVLTPKQRHRVNGRKINSCRQKPLSLVLDVADSLNIQLLLPEQSLWKKQWETLRETYCKIPKASWGDIIPRDAGIMIPEQVVNVKDVSELWQWQLLDHRGNCLIEWKVEGVASDFPCLIFDAWTGERLNFDSVNLTIRGTEEIICFTPKSIQLDFGNDIEILDSYVPCSIRGWQGQHLALTTKESSIIFRVFYDAETTTSREIIWKLSVEEQPSLRGLKLKGKKSVYLETPIFWYPPVEQEISLNISIENIARRESIISTTTIVHSSNRWQGISLDKWITEPGKYEARFWNQFHRWSYQFDIQLDYQITSNPDIKKLTIKSGLQDKIETLPISYDCRENFWAEEVHIEGLFPLETLTFYLSNKIEKVHSLAQADSLGNLRLNLASLDDLLPSDSDWYALDYQQLGGEPQRLIEMEISPPVINWTWANQAIHLSGLSSDELYSLNCWNLLLPENSSREIKIPLIAPDTESITVPLELPSGIYHIQMFSSHKQLCNLGWWCGSNQYDVPDEVQENEDLENYCYTILGDESVEDFLQAVNKFDYDCQQLKIIIHSLEKSWHFPEWLNHNSLLEKLQALVDVRNQEIAKIKLPEPEPISPEFSANDLLPVRTSQEKWFLLTVNNPKKREVVNRQIQNILVKHHLQNKISIPVIPKQWIYNNLLLLECSHLELVYHYIQPIEYINKIEPLKLKDVQQMLRV